MEFKIKTLWNDAPIDHEPVVLRFEGVSSAVKLTVEAPYFNDPKPPGGQVGQPFPGLWEYEVVEAFFLNDKNQYLEVEVSPHGQHLVLQLDGSRNCVKDELPMEYQATINGQKWTGIATIPSSYFPCQVSKLNCYAIHGCGDQRVYESLYPTPMGKFNNPDFHRLQYFQGIKFSTILPENVEVCSELWGKQETK